MSAVLGVSRLEDTKLWQKLDVGHQGPDAGVARALSQGVLSVCQEAADRMKAFATHHPQFTLHDETHFLRVTYLMGKIIPDTVMDQLNPIEIALLILSAYLHDQGMVLDESERMSIEGDPKFDSFRKNWELEHPNVEQIRQRLRDERATDNQIGECVKLANQLHAAMFTDFVRTTHGDRSARYIRSRFSDDPRMMVGRTGLSEYVARLSGSHVRPAAELNPDKGFHYDESIGTYRVNLAYLGIILRLADILDFDRDRVPEALRRTIHFTSSVSIQEWAKHGAVDGWVIDRSMVRFTMRCEHPAYQKAALQFMDWIDEELAETHFLVKRFPKIVERYTIDLPNRVDRSRIEPKAGAYIYRDLEFALSRDEVVKLLMTDKLYQSTTITVRELVQNALDALRYRRAIMQREEGINWPNGKVVLVHELDENGNEVLRCTDNGVGMTLEVVERFLTKAGRSYYRSYEFERERSSFVEHGCDFDPCSQFGIGFMSCFMLGDHITIRTRRYFGPNQAPGKPLAVEVNGLSGLLVIREDPGYREFGTTVEISLRTRNEFFDEEDDPVRLVDTVKRYVKAPDFVVEAQCNIPDMTAKATVQPGVSEVQTEIEASGVEQVLFVEQDLNALHTELHGKIKGCFLTSVDGTISLSNSVAAISHERFFLKSSGRSAFWDERTICLDGIAVWGTNIRNSRTAGARGNIPNVGRHAYILDARGQLKPPITPARSVPDRASPHWHKISSLLNKGVGILWEPIASRVGRDLDPRVFWELVWFYRPWLPWMRTGVTWSNVSFPCTQGTGEVEYRLASSIRSLIPVAMKEHGVTWANFVVPDGSVIDLRVPTLPAGTAIRNELLEACLMSLVTLIIRDGKVTFEFREPDNPEERSQSRTGLARGSQPYPVPYAGEVRHCLAVQAPVRTVNLAHPLFLEATKGNFVVEPPPHQRFAKLAIQCFTSWVTQRHLGQSSPRVSSLMRRLGRLYGRVEWSSYSAELAPPYSLWISNVGIRMITSEDLREWALCNELADEE